MTTNQLERRAISNDPREWEGRIVTAIITAAVVLAALPVLFAAFITPPERQFLGVTYNTDDFCNYLSWMRQTKDGHLFLRNLFTTDPQGGVLQVNILFSLLGLIARVTNLPLAVVWHLVRIPSAVGVLWLTYRFCQLCLPTNRTARLVALGFAALGSGFGWWSWRLWEDKNIPGSPIDAWQPEAYTFLSLCTSTLFTVSLLFILGALHAMLLGERTGKARYAVVAGLCGAVLGDIHTYDVVHIGAAWALSLIVWTVMRRFRGVGGTWLRTAIATAVMAPTVLYQYYVFTHNTVFQKRVGVPTLSPEFWRYPLGYGLPFALAVVMVAVLVVRAVRGRKEPHPNPLLKKGEGAGNTPEAPLSQDRDAGGSGAPPPLRGGSWPFHDTQTAILIICWAVAGLSVIYLPVSFQRKMLMGEHFPLCLLAGAAAAILVQKLRTAPRAALAVALVLAAAPSNVLFVAREIRHVTLGVSETDQGPYIYDTLLEALSWIDKEAPPGAAVFGFPDDCLLVPGYTGHPVWAGHWGETPEYGAKLAQFRVFIDAAAPDYLRAQFLPTTNTQYVLYPVHVGTFPDRKGNVHTMISLADDPPPYLREVHRNKDYVVFEVNARK
jgi:hypothetical protein